MRNFAANDPATAPTRNPVEVPRIDPEVAPWPQRYTDPIHICPQQKREMTSPDIEP